MDIKKKILSFADAKKAKILQGFFKTGPGEYGEGDIFIGVTVPLLRKIALEYRELALPEIEKLLTSPIHEERLVALFILVSRYEKGSPKDRNTIFKFYLKHTPYINNWDLVDQSAYAIVGAHLFGKEKTLLLKLARSKNLWERRIAIVSTFYEIRQKNHETTFLIAEILLSDREDLMHKAVGWMLREVGKRCSEKKLEAFLRKHYKNLPRTALRYAIERFPEAKRLKYLNLIHWQGTRELIK